MTLDMTCEELVRHLTDYLEDTMPPDERTRLEKHLATCPSCETYLDQMRMTLKALGHIPAASIPDEGVGELLDVFRKWRDESR